ncbi:MAG: phosphoglycolate phosphatase [Rhodospirillales bacterium]|nr:phosphoglycolate phosphatase [Rhodospirillales bacterium]
MRVITLIVFDLDGTLIDSAPDLQAALNTMLTEAGRRPLLLDEVIAIVGDGAGVLVRRALAITGGLGAESETDRLLARFLAIYEAHAADLTYAYCGVEQTLAALRAAGFRLGICTNKPERMSCAILAKLGLDSYFSAVIGGDSVPGARKPDPRHLEAALVALGGAADQAVMVGDSINDVAAARSLGVPVIVRTGGYGAVPTEDLGADIIIREFAELPAAISRLS